MSGPCEDCAVVGAYWVREDGASEKKWQFFWTWAMKVLCEVTMCKKKIGGSWQNQSTS